MMSKCSPYASGAWLLLLLLASSRLPGSSAQAPPPDLSAIPEACLNGGTEVQTLCQDTFTAAQTFFNVQLVNGQPAAAAENVTVTQEQIEQFIATAPPPSAECCRAACNFNNNFCSCEQAVLDFAVQVAGNDPNIYRSIATGFARVCQFNLYYADSCPLPADRLTAVKDTCQAAVPGTANATANATAGANSTANATAAAPELPATSAGH